MNYSTRKLYTHKQRLVKDCRNGAEAPQEWKEARISVLHIGRKTRANVALKEDSRLPVHGKIIKKKIEGEYTDLQAGFRV